MSGKPCGVVNAVGKLNDNEHGVVLRECGCGGVFKRMEALSDRPVVGSAFMIGGGPAAFEISGSFADGVIIGFGTADFYFSKCEVLLAEKLYLLPDKKHLHLSLMRPAE